MTGTSVKNKEKAKPCGLNTVNLLRTASKSFGCGAQHTMKIAEKLYLNGFITYPRTESTNYSENFDFNEILNNLSSHPTLGALANTALSVWTAIKFEIDFHRARKGTQCWRSPANYSSKIR